MKAHFVVLAGAALFSVVGICLPQTNNVPQSPTTLAPPDSVPSKVLIDYAGFLRGEAEAHRKFLEAFYDKVIWILGVGTAAIGLLAGFIGWRTVRDVEKVVSNLFLQRAENLIQEKIKVLNSEIKTAQDKNRQLDEAQRQQQGELFTVKLLFDFFAAEEVFDYLVKLSKEGPVPYSFGAKAEIMPWAQALRRARDMFKLIEMVDGKTIGEMPLALK